MTRIWILLLLISTTTFPAARAIDRIKVKEYYLLKNKAELAITDSAYATALALYKQAFACKFPNPCDIYNAFVVAYLLKDTAAGKSYYNTLAELGINKKKFEELPFVTSIKDDMFYIRDIAWNEEYYQLKYMMSARPAVARMLDSLYAADQFYRKYYSRDTFFYHDKQIINYLCDYVKRNGFPGFEQAGICQREESAPYNDGTIQLIHWHTRGSDPNLSPWAKSLDSVLYNAVLDGNYDPANYALSVDQRDSNYYEQLQPVEEMLSEDGLELAKLDIPAINRKRAGIYLEPLEDYIRKWKFSLNDDRFYLFGPFVVINNRKTIKKMLRDTAGMGK